MLHLTADTQILLAAEPVDFRRGIDGLAALCEQQLNQLLLFFAGVQPIHNVRMML